MRSGLRSHLRAHLMAMFSCAQGATVTLWPSVINVAKREGIARSTVQRRNRKLRDLRILTIEHMANTHINPKHFRRSTTYRLHPENLPVRPKLPEGERPHRSIARHAAHKRPPQPESVVTKPSETLGSRQSERERKLRLQLTEKIAELMKPQGRPPSNAGRTGPDPNCTKCKGTGLWEHQGHPGKLWACHCVPEPDDPHYRPGMTEENALIAACMALGIGDVEKGRELLKLRRHE